MCNNEGVFQRLNGVLYYSNTGQSKRIAEYVSKKLDYPIADMLTTGNFVYENLVVVFPVHCQNIPDAVKNTFEKLKAQRVVLLVTYGKKSYGNVLYECQKKYKFCIVGGGYIPTKHSYIPDDNTFDDFEKLDFIKQRFDSGLEVKIPRSAKNPFADFFPKWRSRAGVKIIRKENCNICKHCYNKCPSTDKCIRCMKCVFECPSQALEVKFGLFMKLYLKKIKKDKLLLY